MVFRKYTVNACAFLGKRAWLSSNCAICWTHYSENARKFTRNCANTRDTARHYSGECAWLPNTKKTVNRRTGKPANQRTGKPANRQTGEPANRQIALNCLVFVKHTICLDFGVLEFWMSDGISNVIFSSLHFPWSMTRWWNVFFVGSWLQRESIRGWCRI